MNMSHPMNTSLSHLTPVQCQELETAKRIIIQAVRPEKIILFGIYSVEAESPVYLPNVSHRGSGLIDLLVVTSQGDRHSDYELQDIIENRCRDQVAVTALVHDIGYVNRRIAEGQYFFMQIRRDAILLYDAGRTPLSKRGGMRPGPGPPDGRAGF